MHGRRCVLYCWVNLRYPLLCRSSLPSLIREGLVMGHRGTGLAAQGQPGVFTRWRRRIEQCEWHFSKRLSLTILSPFFFRLRLCVARVYLPRLSIACFALSPRPKLTTATVCVWGWGGRERESLVHQVRGKRMEK